jgi:hypothetical protein
MNNNEYRRNYSWSWKRYILPLHKTLQRVVFLFFMLSVMFVFYYLYKNHELAWQSMKNRIVIPARFYQNFHNTSHVTQQWVGVHLVSMWWIYGCLIMGYITIYAQFYIKICSKSYIAFSTHPIVYGLVMVGSTNEEQKFVLWSPAKSSQKMRGDCSNIQYGLFWCALHNILDGIFWWSNKYLMLIVEQSFFWNQSLIWNLFK